MISARIGFGAKLLAALLVAVLLAQGVMLLLPNQSNTALAASTQRTLRKGCTGDDVKQLQVRLSSLGYMSSSLTTGYFGSITFDAVKRFQRDSKITVDGIAGKQTFAALDIAAPVTSGGGSSGGTSPTDNNQEGGRYTYKYQSVQVVLKKGSRSDHVADMQTALKQRGYLDDTIDGIFGNNTLNAVLAFQRANGLTVDGIAGEQTLGVLYSMLDAPSGALDSIQKVREGLSTRDDLPVERLNWSDVDTAILPRKTDFVIVDALTGYTFAARRTGGTLHADVETITALDTYTFFKAVGKWSWERRAVWVIVGERKLAASMNCQPHGYDTISGNDMVGQFCIHFVGSRTHGSNSECPDHLAAINKAYEWGQN